MSGALLFWSIVLDVWSIVAQLTTWTSRSMPVFCLYFSANCFQNAAVWSLEYSAATSLIRVTFFAAVSPPPPPAELEPMPPLHAARPRAATDRVAAVMAKERWARTMVSTPLCHGEAETARTGRRPRCAHAHGCFLRSST